MDNTNKLVERLRHLLALNEPRYGGPYQGFAASECMEALEEAANALEALARRPPAPGSVGARVKPLVWPSDIRRGDRVRSKGGLIEYCIAHYGGSEPESGVVYRWAAEGEVWSEAFFAYEHAITAAQADYATRILSALEPDTDADEIERYRARCLELAGEEGEYRWWSRLAEILEVALRSAPAPEDGWRGIKTAPKDGTWVLLFGDFHSNSADVPLVARFDERALTQPGGPFGRFVWLRTGDTEGSIAERWPTHWRPLPAAPNPPSQGGE